MSLKERPGRGRRRTAAGLPGLIVVALVAGGCAGGGSAAAPAAPTPAAVVTVAPAHQASPAIVAAASSPAPAPAAPVSVTLPTGLVLRGGRRSAPGPYFLGRIDAPVVLEEYGDYQ